MSQKLWKLSWILFLLAGNVAEGQTPHQAKYAFPDDVSVINVVRDCGAKGDGIADDTVALQRGLDASCGELAEFRNKSAILFIPNGTYRVTQTLVVRHSKGPWIYGESRDGVVIRLDDGVKGLKSVLRTHANDEGPTSADWFMRNLRSFTIDVGNNPDVDGIRYFATNTGTLQDVRVIGNGKVGINAGFLGQSGPNLIDNVIVEGYETGILSQWIWGETISRATIRNCRKVGVEVSANVAAIEDLVVENTPIALHNKIPNDWGHWGGSVALINARINRGAKPSSPEQNSTEQTSAEQTSAEQSPAIINDSILYARNLSVEGYETTLRNHQSQSLTDPSVQEFISSPHKKLFDKAKPSSLNLPIEPLPKPDWEYDFSKWLCADDFGINSGDNENDTAGFQAAFDAAAKENKTVVYLRGCGGAEPNWYRVHQPIRIPKTVKMVIALGWGRILGIDNGAFVVDDQSAPVVHVRGIDAFGGPTLRVINRSQNNTLVVESSGVHVVGEGTGKIFVHDCSGQLTLSKAGQRCWTRQLNPEGESDTGLVRNAGGVLWCLGVKHEGRGIRFATSAQGATEILGLSNYGGYKDENDARPLFNIDNGSFSVAALREIAFDQHTALIKVREKQATTSQELDKHNEGGWIGWTLYRSGESQ